MCGNRACLLLIALELNSYIYMLRQELSPPTGVTCGINYRLKTSTDGRISQPKNDLWTDLSHVRMQHVTYTSRSKASAKKKSGRNKEILVSSEIGSDWMRKPDRPIEWQVIRSQSPFSAVQAKEGKVSKGRSTRSRRESRNWFRKWQAAPSIGKRRGSRLGAIIRGWI